MPVKEVVSLVTRIVFFSMVQKFPGLKIIHGGIIPVIRKIKSPGYVFDFRIHTYCYVSLQGKYTDL
jgi:hypothetical protein